MYWGGGGGGGGGGGASVLKGYPFLPIQNKGKGAGEKEGERDSEREREGERRVHLTNHCASCCLLSLTDGVCMKTLQAQRPLGCCVSS